MADTKEFSVFANADTGETVTCDAFANQILHSPDGKLFYHLKVAGFSGSREEYHLDALDLRGGVERKVEVNLANSVMTYDGRTLVLQKDRTFDPTKQPVVPLPAVRQCQYFFQNTVDKTVIYVSADKYNFSYESFKLFTGRIGTLIPEVPISNVKRYKDGGTTYVYTEKGTLFAPTRAKGMPSTWNAVVLVKLDPANFNISEIEDNVSVIAK